jgi:hypothetical protein
MSFDRSKLLLALLGSIVGTGSLFGSIQLSITAGASVTVTCNTATGPGTAASVTVKNTGSQSVTITSVQNLPKGIGVTSPTLPITLTTSGTTQSATLTLNYAAGCLGAGTATASGSVANATFYIDIGSSTTPVADAALTAVNYTYTVSTTPLTISPSPVTVTCLYTGSGDYTANTTTVTVSSNANLGTPFTVASAPGWLTLGSAGTATASGYSISFTPTNCTGVIGSSMTGTVTLAAYPTTLTKSVTVTLLVVGPSPLTLSSVATKTYVKNSGSYPSWTVNVSSSPSGLYFTIDPTSLPNWLTASAMGASASTAGVAITFQATPILDTMTAGNLSASVVFKVTGYANTVLTIRLVVDNPASTLSAVEGTVRNLTWIQGQPLPTANITAVSSDAPISFTISTTGAIALPSQTSGVAYNFGTVIPVTFNVTEFAQAQPGNVLTGTETLQYGSNSLVVTFNITVQSGSSSATLSGISPTNLPTAVVGQTFNVNLYGTGFIPSTDPTQRTNVGIVSNGAIVADPAITNVNVVNSSSIVLTIMVPSNDSLLPWSDQIVTFGVCNPAGGSCTVPTGTVTLLVGAGPIISAVSSASKGIPTTSVAPYDIISLWGYNFCSSNGTGCSANQVLYGEPDPVTVTYPTVNGLSPDNGQRRLTVTFQTHGTSTVIATAPLLFASNT